MADVTIAIPTFRRPKGLARVLESLAQLDTEADVSVIIGDNDAEGRQGFAVCEAYKKNGYRWPLDAIVVPERGISQNRNALVARALENPQMQFLVMVDDDEWVDPHWLDALLHAQALFQADVVGGPVSGVSEGAAKRRPYDGISTDGGASGQVDMLHGAGNVLLTRARLDLTLPPYFDLAFALTGGEDKEFFVRLAREGARFAWSAEARCFTAVPLSRATVRWILARAYRIGNSDMRVFLKHRESIVAMMAELAKIAGALLVSSFLFLILVACPNRRMAALCKLSRAVGKTAALFGSHYQEYSVTHGD